MKINFDTTQLKAQIEQNPLVAAGIGAALLTGAAKLMNANNGRRNSKTWAKEVKRRSENQK